MKLEELKHNHSLTDLLKILIFAILMLAPIGAVFTRCMYVVCNKNAYQSYYGETINEEIDVEIEDNELKPNQDYKLYIPIQNTVTGSFRVVFNGDITINNTVYSNYNQIEVFNTNSTPYFGIYGTGQTTVYLYINTTSIDMLFNYNSMYNNNSSLIYDFYETTYNKNSYLDNVFEYSVNELENSQLFNWTENTAIYTGVKAMTTGLEISGNVIPMLITYWLLLMVIYIILDIVIVLFTKITHLLGNRTT